MRKIGIICRANSNKFNQTTLISELLIQLNRQGHAPLRAQLESEVRLAIQTARLKAGDPLPSTRVLAAYLGVSRGVVVEAYEQLCAEGYLSAHRGSATRVASSEVNFIPTPQHHAAQAQRSPIDYDFRPGLPDLRLFPRRIWLSSMRTASDKPR